MAAVKIRAYWKSAWERISKHPLARIGPGLITGVADDDPSGIATYSQAERPIWPEHAVDYATRISADGSDTVHVRPNWPRHRQRAGR